MGDFPAAGRALCKRSVLQTAVEVQTAMKTAMKSMHSACIRYTVRHYQWWLALDRHSYGTTNTHWQCHGIVDVGLILLHLQGALFYDLMLSHEQSTT